MRLERGEDTASASSWQEIYRRIEYFYAETVVFRTLLVVASYNSATFQDNLTS